MLVRASRGPTAFSDKPAADAADRMLTSLSTIARAMCSSSRALVMSRTARRCGSASTGSATSAWRPRSSPMPRPRSDVDTRARHRRGIAASSPSSTPSCRPSRRERGGALVQRQMGEAKEAADALDGRLTGKDREGGSPVALGIIAALGGFLDIGDLVFNTQAGALFRYDLIWAVVSARRDRRLRRDVRPCRRGTGRPVFDMIRMRLGFSAGLVACGEQVRQPAHRRRRARRSGDRARAAVRRALQPVRSLAAIGSSLIVALLPFGGIERMFGYGGLMLLVFVATAIHRAPTGARSRTASFPDQRLDALPLLRRRRLLGGADALRGPLLFLGRGRGGLGPRRT